MACAGGGVADCVHGNITQVGLVAGMRPRWGMLKKRILSILPSLDQHINKFYMWKEELQLHLEQKQFVLQVCFAASLLYSASRPRIGRKAAYDSSPCEEDAPPCEAGSCDAPPCNPQPRALYLDWVPTPGGALPCAHYSYCCTGDIIRPHGISP